MVVKFNGTAISEWFRKLKSAGRCGIVASRFLAVAKTTFMALYTINDGSEIPIVVGYVRQPKRYQKSLTLKRGPTIDSTKYLARW